MYHIKRKKKKKTSDKTTVLSNFSKRKYDTQQCKKKKSNIHVQKIEIDTVDDNGFPELLRNTKPKLAPVLTFLFVLTWASNEW